MPDTQYFDVQGRPIGTSAEKSTYYDSSGKPITAQKDDFGPSQKLPVPPQEPDRAEYNRRAVQFWKEGLPGGLPMIGSILGGPAGTLAGSMAKQVINPSSDLSSAATETGKDFALNELIPKGISSAVSSTAGLVGKVAKKLVSNNNPAVKDWIDQHLSSMLTPKSDIVEEASGLAKQRIPPGPTINPLATSDFPEETIKKGLESVTNVRNWKATTGEPFTIEKGALDQSIKKGYSGQGQVDPDKILKELHGPDKGIYDEAITPDTKNTLEGFLNKVKELQPTTAKGILPGMLNYSNRRLAFDAATMIGGTMLGHGPGTIASVMIGEAGLSALMRSRTLGNLAIKALETPAGTEQARVIGQALLTGLRGTSVWIQTKDGKTEQAQVDSNGQIVQK